MSTNDSEGFLSSLAQDFIEDREDGNVRVEYADS